MELPAELRAVMDGVRAFPAPRPVVDLAASTFDPQALETKVRVVSAPVRTRTQTCMRVGRQCGASWMAC